MTFLLLTLFIILFSFSSDSLALQCKDESGQDVDWFVVYKIPKLEKSSKGVLTSGYAYAYVTDKTVNEGDWRLSNKLINQSDSIMGKTLSPLYNAKNKNNQFSFILYNDQVPEKSSSSSSRAHAKGVVVIDKQTSGFWLIHSVPKFPPFLNESYSYPLSGRENGQTGVCITIKNDNQTLNNLAQQLLIMKPQIYHSQINSDLSQSALWKQIINRKWIKNKSSNQLPITSKSGLKFHSFVKTSQYPGDLYSNLVAPSLQVDLLVQTWRNGKGDALESNCSVKYKVENIDMINLYFGNGNFVNNNDWSYTEDHSKWSVADNTNSKYFTCIGDINRMKSQFKRGGGTVCVEQKQLWNTFKKSVEGIEGCKRKSSPKQKTN